MRVIFIGNDTSILTGINGDSRQRQLEYAKRFAALTIIVMCQKESRLRREKIDNLTVIPTNSANRWLYLYDSLRIIRSLRGYDLISTQDPFVAGLIGVIAKLIFGMKLNIQVHNVFFKTHYFKRESLFNYIFYWLGKFNLLFANSVRVVNPRERVGRNCFLAPVAADLDFFWANPHAIRFGRILCIARLVKQKNLPLLFSVAKRFPGFHFTVVGEGEEKKQLEKDKPENVELIGQKNRDEVKQIYSQSDIFVLSSNYEGYAITVIEAMASGIPVVMTDTGCARSLIVHNKIGGMVFPVGDADQMAFCIKYLLENRDKSTRLVIAGQKLLKERFTKGKLIKLFIDGLKNTK